VLPIPAHAAGSLRSPQLASGRMRGNAVAGGRASIRRRWRFTRPPRRVPGALGDAPICPRALPDPERGGVPRRPVRRPVRRAAFGSPRLARPTRGRGRDAARRDCIGRRRRSRERGGLQSPCAIRSGLATRAELDRARRATETTRGATAAPGRSPSGAFAPRSQLGAIGPYAGAAASCPGSLAAAALRGGRRHGCRCVGGGDGPRRCLRGASFAADDGSPTGHGRARRDRFAAWGRGVRL
jgi:hypothetical protein